MPFCISWCNDVKNSHYKRLQPADFDTRRVYPTSIRLTCLAATTSTTSPTMKYSELETKVQSWMSELEQQEKLFLNQATQINAWNKLLMENADKVCLDICHVVATLHCCLSFNQITALNTEFENIESSQKRLNTELGFIKKQEDELEELLKPLEENVKQQMSSFSSSVHTHHADIERERT